MVSMKNLYVFVLSVISLLIAFPSVTYAHQNGCHRWHSCPSDSGSYVCGDLGYDTYCGGEYIQDEPDYEAEGRENGSNHASDDKTMIVNIAEKNANIAGYDDGKDDLGQDSQTDSSEVCEKTFNFEGYAPDDYQTAYHDAYSQFCSETFTEAYTLAYTTAYERGQDDYLAEQSKPDKSIALEDSGFGEGNPFGLLWAAGLIGLGSIWYMAASKRDSPK